MVPETSPSPRVLPCQPGRFPPMTQRHLESGLLAPFGGYLCLRGHNPSERLRMNRRAGDCAEAFAMHSTDPAYGLWSLVVINSAIFLFLAFSFWHPKTKRDWHAFRRVFRVHHRSLYGDVRLPADDLPDRAVAAKAVSRNQFVEHDFGHLRTI